MSDIKKLFKHSSSYFSGQILLLAAGFISFPIYTRILSVSEYGLLGLISTTITLVVAFSKLGIQHSIIRFFPEFHSINNNSTLEKFYSTLFISIIIISLSAYLLFISAVFFLSSHGLDSNTARLLTIVSFLILTNCSLDTFAQFLRAEQKPKSYVLLTTSSRYGTIFLAILFYFFIDKTLHSLLQGMIVWQTLLFLIFSYSLVRTRSINIRSFSFSFLKKALKYGIPLIPVELSHLVLHFGDRYLIQYYLGPAQLGIYAAGYSIATYAAQLLTLPVRDAVFPICMEIWENQGPGRTRLFLSKTLNYFCLISFPLIFGFIIVSPDLVVILASSKYTQSTCIMPYVLVGLLIYGTWPIFGASLLLHKRTSTISFIIAISCAANIFLNILLIPRFEILGAALSTTIAYFIYISSLIIASFSKLRFFVDFKRILIYFFCSIVMFIFIWKIPYHGIYLNIVLKIFVGFGSYCFLVILFDGELRSFFFRRFRIVTRIS